MTRFSRKQSLTSPAKRTRYDRLSTPDLELMLETSLQRTAELYRGLHGQADQEWLLKQMETEVVQALGVLLSLQRRVVH